MPYYNEDIVQITKGKYKNYYGIIKKWCHDDVYLVTISPILFKNNKVEVVVKENEVRLAAKGS